MMTRNLNKIPEKQWRKWTVPAKTTFNRVYPWLLGNQTVCLHPRTKPIPPREWKTVAWNTAWVAADACNEAIA